MTPREESRETKMIKREKRKAAMRSILTIEAVVILFLLVFLVFWVRYKPEDATAADTATEAESTVDTPKQNELSTRAEETLSAYTTIAVFGVDSRSGESYTDGDADSILLVSIDNTTKQVRTASVYRDTAVDIDGTGSVRRAFLAYRNGGAENAVAMLNRNLDLNIQSYVSVNMKALADLVDAVGGVELKLTEEEASYTNFYIGETAKITSGTATKVRSGSQTLSGAQAAAYCRVRYTEGGDPKRTERVCAVLEKVAAGVKELSATQLSQLVNILAGEVETSMTPSDLTDLAAGAADYELVDSTAFPFAMKNGDFGAAGALNVPCSLASNVQQLYAFLYNDEAHECSETVKSISSLLTAVTGYTEEDAENVE